MAVCAYRSRFVRLVIVVGALALLLSGCDLPWQAKPSDIAKDQTLEIVWTGSYYRLSMYDPAEAYDSVTIQTTNLLFDGLVTVDRNEHIEPWGATSWTISPDGLTYTFKLRPNQRFSDGTPVKPSDYAWSMDRAANPCTQSVLAYDLAVIKDVTAFSAQTCDNGPITTLVGDSIIPNDGANTLTIRLAQPASYALAALASTPAFVVERGVVSITGPTGNHYWTDHMSDGKTGQGGSGMFYVSAQTPEGGVILKPNPYWWGRQAGKTQHFSKVIINSTTSAAANFTQFASDPSLAFADQVVDLQPNFPLATTKKQSYYHEQPILMMTSLLLNWKIVPFDDINARKAFCLAINRDQINQQIFQGSNLPTWHLLPQGMPGYNEHLHGLDNAPVTGDMALARDYWQRYLAAHPKATAPTALQGLFNQGRVSQTIKPILQEAFQQLLGNNLTLQDFWIPHVLGAAPGWEYTVPLSLLGWSQDYPDPQDFLTLLYSHDALLNTENASIPAADALMKQADALPDLSQRIPRYQQAEQLLIDNVAACPLFQLVNHYALRSWVKGDFVEDARGLFPNDAWVTGYIAKH